MSRRSQSSTARFGRFLVVLALVATATLWAQAQSASASAGPGYQATILGTLCTSLRSGCPTYTYPLSNGAGINDSGWIVGDSNYPGIWVDPNHHPKIALRLTEHATVWRDGKITDLGTLGGPNSSIGFVARPNDTGLISGNAQTATLDPNHEGWALNLSCTPTGASCGGPQYEIKGFAWQNGVMRPLPTLGGNNALAFGVANDWGQLVGTAENANKDSNCVSPVGGPTQVLDYEAVVWEPPYDTIQELPPYPGDGVGAAAAINDLGQVVGGSGSCAPPSTPAFNIAHALLWKGRSVTDLGNLGGTMNNLATAINNRGQVVGMSDLAYDTTFHAFLWQNGVMTDLGTLPGDAYSIPYGINDVGQVVGQSCDQNNNCRAFLWQNGVMTDLNQITQVNAPGSSDPYCLAMAEGINSHGEITGIAVDPNTLNTLAFSALPATNPQASNQVCGAAAHNATGINTGNALSPALAPWPPHRFPGLGVLTSPSLGLP